MRFRLDKYIAGLFGFYVLSCANEDFRLFLESISFGAKYEVFGIKLNLALFYIPLCVGMAEHIFKIHDKLASLLRIRFNYKFRASSVKQSRKEIHVFYLSLAR